MDLKCPHCDAENRPVARFCAFCGEQLGDQAHGAGSTGADPTVRFAHHPDPLRPPDGFVSCDNWPDLHYRWQAAWGGSMLLGTETIAIILFNAGFALEEVALTVHGQNAGGQEIFTIERHIDELPRGKEVTLEVPSYELPGPAQDIGVSLTGGKISRATQNPR